MVGECRWFRAVGRHGRYDFGRVRRVDGRGPDGRRRMRRYGRPCAGLGVAGFVFFSTPVVSGPRVDGWGAGGGRLRSMRAQRAVGVAVPATAWTGPGRGRHCGAAPAIVFVDCGPWII